MVCRLSIQYGADPADGQGGAAPTAPAKGAECARHKGPHFLGINLSECERRVRLVVCQVNVGRFDDRAWNRRLKVRDIEDRPRFLFDFPNSQARLQFPAKCVVSVCSWPSAAADGPRLTYTPFCVC
jgi:hypothetical protein